MRCRLKLPVLPVSSRAVAQDADAEESALDAKKRRRLGEGQCLCRMTLSSFENISLLPSLQCAGRGRMQTLYLATAWPIRLQPTPASSLHSSALRSSWICELHTNAASRTTQSGTRCIRA